MSVETQEAIEKLWYPFTLRNSNAATLRKKVQFTFGPWLSNEGLFCSMGYPVVAFSQEKLHRVLHLTANESCRDSNWMTKD